MKTVVIEFIEYLREHQFQCTQKTLDEFLEKEKQQTINFSKKCQLVRDVDCDGNVTFCFDPKEQFDKTFNN